MVTASDLQKGRSSPLTSTKNYEPKYKSGCPYLTTDSCGTIYIQLHLFLRDPGRIDSTFVAGRDSEHHQLRVGGYLLHLIGYTDHRSCGGGAGHWLDVH